MRDRKIHFVLLLACLGASVSAQSPSPTPASAAQPPQSASNGPVLPRLLLVFPAVTPPADCVQKLQTAVQEYRASHNDAEIRKMLDFKSNQLCSIYLGLASQQYAAARASSQVDVDRIIKEITQDVKAIAQQNGSSSGTGGSTNLASKGVAAKFLSLASEYGALTESTSNLTTTVQGTLAGVPVVFLNRGLAQECSTRLLALTPCVKSDVLTWLNRISYSVSFDSSQNGQSLTGTASGPAIANTQPATFTASTHTINAFSVKFIALTGGKVDADKIKSSLDTFTGSPQSTDTRALATFFQMREILNQANFDQWQQGKVMQLRGLIDQGATLDDLVKAWKADGTSFMDALGVPSDIPGPDAAKDEAILKLADFAVDYSRYLAREEQTSLSLAKPPALTFEYDNNRPAGQPTNSVFRAIYQRTFSQATITGNGALSIYNSTPSSSVPGASLLRDVQAAFQVDHNISLNTALTGKLAMTATAAYYFQYQSSPAILNVNASSPLPGISFTGLPANATQVFAQKGNISVGQLKLSVGSGSNIKVPISVTYSNRTELVTKPVWRGQVGISYDFDSLFQGSGSK